MTVEPVVRALAAAPLLPFRLALRQVPALLLAGLLVVLLSGRLSEVDPPEVTAALGQLVPRQWAAALAFAGLSFWAVGRYDALVHRYLGTGRGEAEARRAGLLAIAIGQMAGFGLLTGALVRLRMLPGLGLGAAVRITLAVTVLFLAAWAVVTAAAVLALPAPGPLRPLAWGVMAAVPLVLVLAVLRPEFAVFGRRLRLPALATMAPLAGLAAVDTLAAGLCLAVLLPPEVAVPLAVLIPAFLLAFGAGLVSGAPGGMGAFEVVLLALLPFAPAGPLLAGILAWRVVYYAVPTVLAMALLARGPWMAERAAPSPEPVSVDVPPSAAIEAVIARSRRAEAGLLRQGDELFLPLPARHRAGQAEGAMLTRTGQALTMIGDPLGGARPQKALAALARAAHDEGRLPCLYKAGARLAVAARRAGWIVMPVAREGWLCPAEFRLDAPERRQLRRKLRKAEAAGLAVARAHLPMPIAEMAAVSAAWVAARGGERGVSMGRFAPVYVAAQRVYLARLEGRLVGFLTLHEGSREWTLDLMRTAPDAPDGTMHAALALAIGEAEAAGCGRISLAALPDDRLDAAIARLRPRAGRDGLGQFKRAFATGWETLYIAAPGRFSLALAGLDLLRSIRRPAPLPVRDPAPELGREDGIDLRAA